ncbi:MAG: hypothetical protein ING96_16450 [Roseomonas sp.]|nr:hypothetical protein [Roseomonas sp.]MCA4908179.1 hypothetical protein [Roseomonas sp.]
MADTKTPFELAHPSLAGILPWDLSPPDLANWLRLSITGHFEERLGLRAYGQAARFVVLGDNLAEGLARLAESQGETKLAVFREACALAVEQLDFGKPNHARLLDTLMLLARNITATRALEVLARKINPIKPDDWPLSVYQSAFALAFRFADKDGTRAAILLRHLIAASQQFPVGQVGLALQALAKAEPDALSDHWLLLEVPLQLKYGPGSTRDEEEKRKGRRAQLLKDLSKPIADKANLLLQKASKDGRNVAAPAWWLETIKSSDDPEIVRIVKQLARGPRAKPRPKSPRIPLPADEPKAVPDRAHPRLAKANPKERNLVPRVLRLETIKNSGAPEIAKIGEQLASTEKGSPSDKGAPLVGRASFQRLKRYRPIGAEFVIFSVIGVQQDEPVTADQIFLRSWLQLPKKLFPP